MSLSNVFNIKKNWKLITVLVIALFVSLIAADPSFAASTSQVQSKLDSAFTAIKSVLTGIIVIIGIIAGQKVIAKALPGLDDPHVKNEMWKSLGTVGLAVGAGAAIVWIFPWIWSLFT
ncbi:CagC family type IV secretion system protein [Paraliobacillus ryukyuensis]|uniref:CagC family type IV secretion system protein n=1 Tax=Paraliobacillus ryukyuensis TaxID=200904 RepID=UPI0009A7F842|nr:CagC family type IV secretion system protein [Paraliobacillus ryukyuensis]